MMLIVCTGGMVFGFTCCKKEAKVDTMYEITAEYAPETGTLAGAMKVSFENSGENAFSVLKFQLHPNAYRKNSLHKPVSKAYETSAYYTGESYGEISISSVNGAKNWEVMGEDENILYVFLEKDLFPGVKWFWILDS